MLTCQTATYAPHQDRYSSQDGGVCCASVCAGHEQPCQCTLTRSAERLLIWHVGKGMCCCATANAHCTASSALSLPWHAAFSHHAAARVRSPSLAQLFPDELATWACLSCLVWQTDSCLSLSMSPLDSPEVGHLFMHMHVHEGPYWM